MWQLNSVWSSGKGEVLWEVGWDNNIAFVWYCYHILQIGRITVQAEMFSSPSHMECSLCYLPEGDLSCKKYVAQPIMCLDIHHKIDVMTN